MHLSRNGGVSSNWSCIRRENTVCIPGRGPDVVCVSMPRVSVDGFESFAAWTNCDGRFGRLLWVVGMALAMMSLRMMGQKGSILALLQALTGMRNLRVPFCYHRDLARRMVVEWVLGVSFRRSAGKMIPCMVSLSSAVLPWVLRLVRRV